MFQDYAQSFYAITYALLTTAGKYAREVARRPAIRPASERACLTARARDVGSLVFKLGVSTPVLESRSGAPRCKVRCPKFHSTRIAARISKLRDVIVDCAANPQKETEDNRGSYSSCSYFDGVGLPRARTKVVLVKVVA